jgi:hypothetical protein
LLLSQCYVIIGCPGRHRMVVGFTTTQYVTTNVVS